MEGLAIDASDDMSAVPSIAADDEGGHERDEGDNEDDSRYDGRYEEDEDDDSR